MLNQGFTQKYWNNPKNKMNYNGWTHFYEFWAYPEDLKIASLDYDLTKAQVVKQNPKTVYEHLESNEFSNEILTKNIKFSYNKEE